MAKASAALPWDKRTRRGQSCGRRMVPLGVLGLEHLLHGRQLYGARARGPGGSELLQLALTSISETAGPCNRPGPDTPRAASWLAVSSACDHRHFAGASLPAAAIPAAGGFLVGQLVSWNIARVRRFRCPRLHGRHLTGFEAKSRPEQAHRTTMSRGDRSSLTALYTAAEFTQRRIVLRTPGSAQMRSVMVRYRDGGTTGHVERIHGHGHRWLFVCARRGENRA